MRWDLALLLLCIIAGHQQRWEAWCRAHDVFVFALCTNLISQLPALPIDKRNPEDIDTTSEDHLYDALRYGSMSRPRFSIFDYDPMGRPPTGMRVADSTFGY